jgi:hypothetical protein
VFDGAVRYVLLKLVAAVAGALVGAGLAQMAHRWAKGQGILVALLLLAFAVGAVIEMSGLVGDTNLLSNAGAVAVGTFVGVRLRTKKGSAAS